MWFCGRSPELIDSNGIKHAMTRSSFNLNVNTAKWWLWAGAQAGVCWCSAVLGLLAACTGSIYFSQQINTLKFRIWRHICLLIQFGVAASTCLYSNPGFHLVHVQFYPLGMTHVSGRCRCRAGLLRLKHSVMSWWRSGMPSLFCVFFFYYSLFPHKYFKYFLLIS